MEPVDVTLYGKTDLAGGFGLISLERKVVLVVQVDPKCYLRCAYEREATETLRRKGRQGQE
jgi:hypothetical protein